MTDRHEGVAARSQAGGYVHLADREVTIEPGAIFRTRCGRELHLLPMAWAVPGDRPCTNCERSWAKRDPQADRPLLHRTRVTPTRYV